MPHFCQDELIAIVAIMQTGFTPIVVWCRHAWRRSVSLFRRRPLQLAADLPRDPPHCLPGVDVESVHEAR